MLSRRCSRQPALLSLRLGCSLFGVMATAVHDGDLYRHDGVRITHDPYAPGMAAKYGTPGKTDREGFDPYADSVGAGIYSGVVERDARGAVVIGKQYQGHNARPGPVYAGGGYTPVAKAIATVAAGGAELAALLAAHPDLANDVSTGGALPLHTCGMSRDNQHAAALLIRHGSDIEAVDTYGFTPLHRMASNNLAAGARALLAAGADPLGLSGQTGGPTPLQVAQEGRGKDVIAVLKAAAARVTAGTQVRQVDVLSAGHAPVVGRYVAKDAKDIPAGFAQVCVANGWDTGEMWRKLNGGEGLRWFKHAESEAYIYFNAADRHWWIDGPDGLGAYKAPGPPWAPPGASTAWASLLSGDKNAAGPVLAVFRGEGRPEL